MIASSIAKSIAKPVASSIGVSGGGVLEFPYLMLNGTNDYIATTLTDIALHDAEFSYAVWVKPDLHRDYSAIISIQDYTRTWYINTAGKMHIFGSAITFDSIIPIGVWTHLGLTRDSGNVLRGYVNGVEETTTGSHVIDATGTPVLNIGRDTQPANYLLGGIGDVRMYDAHLSAAQMLAIYNHTSVLTPVIHYKGNEGTGTAIADSGSAANDGTLTSVDLGYSWANTQTTFNPN